MTVGTDRCLSISSNKAAKTFAYLVFTVVLWLSCIMAATLILIPATSVGLTFVLYAVSFYRKEEGGSSMTQPTLAQTARFVSTTGV